MHEVSKHPFERQRIPRDQRQLLCREVQRQGETEALCHGSVSLRYTPQDVAYRLRGLVQD